MDVTSESPRINLRLAVGQRVERPMQIVAVLEGTCPSRDPIVRACREAVGRAAAVTVVSIEPRDRSIANSGALLGLDLLWAAERARALEHLSVLEADARRMAAAYGVELQLRRIANHPARRVPRLTRQVGADVIVIAERSAVQRSRSTLFGRMCWRRVSGRVVVTWPARPPSVPTVAVAHSPHPCRGRLPPFRDTAAWAPASIPARPLRRVTAAIARRSSPEEPWHETE